MGSILQLIENCIFYIYGKTRDCATHDLPYYCKSTCCSLTNDINVSKTLIKSRLFSCRMMSESLATVKERQARTAPQCAQVRALCQSSLDPAAHLTVAGAMQQWKPDCWNTSAGCAVTWREAFLLCVGRAYLQSDCWWPAQPKFLSGIGTVTQVDETWVNIFCGSATLPLKIEAAPVFKTHGNEEHFVNTKAI